MAIRRETQKPAQKIIGYAKGQVNEAKPASNRCPGKIFVRDSAGVWAGYPGVLFVLFSAGAVHVGIAGAFAADCPQGAEIVAADAVKVQVQSWDRQLLHN